MKKINRIISLIISLIIMFTFVSCGNEIENTTEQSTIITASENPTLKTKNVVFYVSTSGDDNNNGGENTPLRTIDGAKNAIRELDKNQFDSITVVVDDGEYRTDSIIFTEEDSGTDSCKITYMAKNNGKAVINGGVTIAPSMFEKITDERMLNRLPDNAKNKVLCVDLGRLGISKSEYGKLYAIGSYGTAEKYEGDWVGGIYCELFYNDERMDLARYPNGSYVKTGSVIKEGEAYEHSWANHVKTEGWENIVNPEPDLYKLSQALADRMASWESFDDVWVYGCFMHDWADSSSPIGYFNHDKKEWSPMFVSRYGAKQGASYYYYNVFEELDVPGEWYLDRETGIMYIYPDGEMATATIDLSLTSDSLIYGENVNNLVFDGIVFKGTRGDAIQITGNNNIIKNCLIKNVSGNAIIMTGYDNLVFSNEITRTGKGGIILDGGDFETLTAGNNKADNNLIHDWAEIYKTYQPAVTLFGVGNICSHNEMHHTPHEAITYKGNNHIIEYNLIHEVCLESTDAGAIYAGNNWSYYGNIIRYNFLYNIGNSTHTANGIYMDDSIPGQIITGNIIVNAKGYSISIGGGRDMVVENNIIVNYSGGKRSISYDSRAADAFDGGWFTSSLKGGAQWDKLNASPYKNEVWQSQYPTLKDVNDNFDDIYDSNFFPNPANSSVKNNVIVNTSKSLGYVSPTVQKYSKVVFNQIYSTSMLSQIFKNYINMDYSLKDDSPVFTDLPDFKAIPISEIGRY